MTLEKLQKEDHEPERDIRAIAVSRGIGIGTAVCLYGRKRQFFRTTLSEDQIDLEVTRFRSAIGTAAEQLRSIVDSGAGDSEAAAGIFDVHLLLLEHSSLASDVEALINEKHFNAEWAIKQVSDGYVDVQTAASEGHFSERAADFQDVAERILNALDGNFDDFSTLTPDSVVIASNIRPSTLIHFGQHRPRAIVTEHGGWTSHAFIMAREMNIPAVTGVNAALRLISDGMTVAVDGYSGRVIVDPEPTTIDDLLDAGKVGSASFVDDNQATAALKTLDGREIAVRINADSSDAVAEYADSCSKGIGLLRSEYLFSTPIAGYPSEEDQTRAYENVARICGERGVRIRTFDLHVDQLAFSADSRENNPALGMRAIRLSLENEGKFREQLRSIIRATRFGKVSIVLPMIAGVDELRRARAIIRAEYDSLNSAIPDVSIPLVGPMIEVPSAVLTIDDLVREADFVALGTNDLVQYLLAVDRDNESLAGHYQTLHPAVLRAILAVSRAADLAGIPAVACGEMAGSPFYVPLLVGLGIREFSMNPHSVDAVRTVISGISFDEAGQLAKNVISLVTADDIERGLKQFYRENWPHLFPPHLLGPSES